MKPRSAKKQFLRRIEEAVGKLASLKPASGVDQMLAFYEELRADGCNLDADDDMLLYQWGTYDWGDGESFEFDITRQFIQGEGEDDNIRQLSLTFKFKPTDTLRRLGDGNRWCHTPDGLPEFREFIVQSAAYQAVEQLKPAKVELDYEGV